MTLIAPNSCPCIFFTRQLEESFQNLRQIILHLCSKSCNKLSISLRVNTKVYKLAYKFMAIGPLPWSLLLSLLALSHQPGCSSNSQHLCICFLGSSWKRFYFPFTHSMVRCVALMITLHFKEQNQVSYHQILRSQVSFFWSWSFTLFLFWRSASPQAATRRDGAYLVLEVCSPWKPMWKR